jgi:hypothetical protein
VSLRVAHKLLTVGVLIGALTLTYAQVPVPGSAAVTAVTRVWTEPEILNMFSNGAAITRQVSFGTIIKFAGGIIGTAALIKWGLDWFYSQAQQATGNRPLDCYYQLSLASCVATNPSPINVIVQVQNLSLTCDGLPVQASNRWITVGPGSNGQPSSGINPYTGNTSGTIPAYRGLTVNGTCQTPHPEIDLAPGVGHVMSHMGQIAAGFNVGFTVNETPTAWGVELRIYYTNLDMRNIIINSPAARTVARNSTDAAVASLGGSTSPWLPPGTAWSGQNVPNVNQWNDAVISTSIDTDGDGWTDAQEIARGTDPSNPLSKPQGDPTQEPDYETPTNPHPNPQPQQPNPNTRTRTGHATREPKPC